MPFALQTPRIHFVIEATVKKRGQKVASGRPPAPQMPSAPRQVPLVSRDMRSAAKKRIGYLIALSARASEFAVDLSSVSLSSQRLLLKTFTGDDAREAFLAATPTIARFMSWEPAPSLEAFEQIWQSWVPNMRAGTDVSLAVRDRPSLEFLGTAGLHNIGAIEPEVGIWIKGSRHGYGYGREAENAVAHPAAWTALCMPATL